MQKALAVLLVFTVLVSCIRAGSESSNGESFCTSGWRIQEAVDFRSLSGMEYKSAMHELKTLAPDVEFHNPWYLWKYEENGRHYALVFSGFPLNNIPGCSKAQVVFVDSQAGSTVAVDTFSTGWRIDLRSAILQKRKGFGAPVLKVNSFPSSMGRDIVRQYYSVDDTGASLIRLEDSKGNVVRNMYAYPNHTIGPTNIWHKAVHDWKDDLHSTQHARILASLVWLGGMHWRKNNQISAKHEDVSVVSEVISLHEDTSVKKIIEDLITSEFEWVATAARNAQSLYLTW